MALFASWERLAYFLRSKVSVRDVEDPGQPEVQLFDPRARRRGLLGQRSVQSQEHEPQLAGQAHQDEVDEELVDVVLHRFGSSHRLKPFGGRLIFGDQQGHLGGSAAPVRLFPAAEIGQGSVEARGRDAEFCVDLRGQCAGLVQPDPVTRVRGMRRVIEQQHDFEVRELLQRRGPQRRPHHLGFFGVGGHSTVMPSAYSAKCRSSSPRGTLAWSRNRYRAPCRAIRYMRAENVRNVTTMR